MNLCDQGRNWRKSFLLSLGQPVEETLSPLSPIHFLQRLSLESLEGAPSAKEDWRAETKAGHVTLRPSLVMGRSLPFHVGPWRPPHLHSRPPKRPTRAARAPGDLGIPMFAGPAGGPGAGMSTAWGSSEPVTDQRMLAFSPRSAPSGSCLGSAPGSASLDVPTTGPGNGAGSCLPHGQQLSGRSVGLAGMAQAGTEPPLGRGGPGCLLGGWAPGDIGRGPPLLGGQRPTEA